MDLYRLHDVALLDGQDYVHAAGYFSEDGVAGCSTDFAGLQLAVDVGVKVGRCVVRYEELGCVGVESGVCH